MLIGNNFHRNSVIRFGSNENGQSKPEQDSVKILIDGGMKEKEALKLVKTEVKRVTKSFAISHEDAANMVKIFAYVAKISNKPYKGPTILFANDRSEEEKIAQYLNDFVINVFVYTTGEKKEDAVNRVIYGIDVLKAKGYKLEDAARELHNAVDRLDCPSKHYKKLV